MRGFVLVLLSVVSKIKEKGEIRTFFKKKNQLSLNTRKMEAL